MRRSFVGLLAVAVTASIATQAAASGRHVAAARELLQSLWRAEEYVSTAMSLGDKSELERQAKAGRELSETFRSLSGTDDNIFYCANASIGISSVADFQVIFIKSPNTDNFMRVKKAQKQYLEEISWCEDALHKKGRRFLAAP